MKEDERKIEEEVNSVRADRREKGLSGEEVHDRAG